MFLDSLYQLTFYHSEKLQSTKTVYEDTKEAGEFYHSEKLQSTKTGEMFWFCNALFYHSEKLQSTKTRDKIKMDDFGFIIAKNYRVLKLRN